MRKKIEGKTIDSAHLLQGLTNTNLYDCLISGGDYALKDTRDITLENCSFSSSCILWNAQNIKIYDSRINRQAASSLHRCEKGTIIDSDVKGACTVRECKDMILRDCSILSPEFGWNCENISLEGCNAHAADILRGSRHVALDNMEIRGDAALQNTESIQVYNSVLNSAYALQNSKNITIVDSVLQGDFIGWNCENITLIGCRILGMQPLCHCRNLKLTNCVMEGCELAFEYSDVKAGIVGHLNSVKNPLSGKIMADSIGHIVMDDASLESTATILVRE